MRLIDADELFTKAKQEDLYLSAARRALYRLIKEAPTVEVEPVKHGRWIATEKGVKVTAYKCSDCGRVVWDDTGYDVSKDYPYCHCGAKMDESTMSQVKVDVSIKKPTKRWDTCGLTEGIVLVDTGSRGEKVDEVEE